MGWGKEGDGASSFGSSDRRAAHSAMCLRPTQLWHCSPKVLLGFLKPRHRPFARKTQLTKKHVCIYCMQGTEGWEMNEGITIEFYGYGRVMVYLKVSWQSMGHILKQKLSLTFPSPKQLHCLLISKQSYSIPQYILKHRRKHRNCSFKMLMVVLTHQHNISERCAINSFSLHISNTVAHE